MFKEKSKPSVVPLDDRFSHIPDFNVYALTGSQKKHAAREIEVIIRKYTDRNKKVFVVSPHDDPTKTTPQDLFNYFEEENYIFPPNITIIMKRNGETYQRIDGGEKIEIFSNKANTLKLYHQRRDDLFDDAVAQLDALQISDDNNSSDDDSDDVTRHYSPPENKGFFPLRDFIRQGARHAPSIPPTPKPKTAAVKMQ
ncbi:MAG: hypothetical protein AB7V32_05330 [Candidatus Berkiella sp.]